MKVLVFGKIEEIVGGKEFHVESVADIDCLRVLLARQYPQLRNFKFAISVDKKIAPGNIPLYEGSEVALLPPFSGG